MFICYFYNDYIVKKPAIKLQVKHGLIRKIKKNADFIDLLP